MNELEKKVFSKLVGWVIGELGEELSCRGCNDFDEKILNLTPEEKEIALKFANYNNADDDYSQSLFADFIVNNAAANMLRVFFGEANNE